MKGTDMAAPAKKAAAKKAAAPEPEADPTPDVSDVRISTKWDSAVNEDTGVRTYDFGDGSTGKAWRAEDGTWSVAVTDLRGRTLSSGLREGITVEQANIVLEEAGARAEKNLATRAAVSD